MIASHVNSAFVSYHDIDATKDQNSAIPSITSLKTDGLHRTLLEKSKKGIVQELSGGCNLSFFLPLSVVKHENNSKWDAKN